MDNFVTAGPIGRLLVTGFARRKFPATPPPSDCPEAADLTMNNWSKALDETGWMRRLCGESADEPSGSVSRASSIESSVQNEPTASDSGHVDGTQTETTEPEG